MKDYNGKNNTKSKKAALIIVALSSFLTTFMGSSINIALPSIGKEFLMDAVLLSWIVTSYLLAAAVFLVPFGKIADIYGRRKVFTYGILIYTLSSFLSLISPSAILLIFFRILQGIGAAMVFVTGVAILTSVFPTEKRGKILGINAASIYLGLSLGPFLGGFLTGYFGWRSIFSFNTFFGLIIIGFVFWKLKGEWVEAKEENFDIPGSVIYSSSLVAIMYGFSLLPAKLGLWLVLMGTLGIFLFVGWQIRVKSPLLNMNLFRNNKIFALSSFTALINYSATFAVAFLLSLYLQYIKGLSPQTAGLVLVSQPVVMTVFSPLAGKLSDRIEPRIVVSAGMTLLAIGLLLFTFLSEKTTLGFIIFSLILIGFGYALFSSPNSNAIMSSVEKKFYGVASAMIGTMRLIGQMFSMGIATLIFALYIGEVQITPSYYSLFLTGMKTAFVIFAFICFSGIFASLARGKIRGR